MLRKELESCLDEIAGDVRKAPKPSTIPEPYINDVDSKEPSPKKLVGSVDDLVDVKRVRRVFKYMPEHIQEWFHFVQTVLVTPRPWMTHPEANELYDEIPRGENTDPAAVLAEYLSLFSMGAMEHLLNKTTDEELESIFAKAQLFGSMLIPVFEHVTGVNQSVKLLHKLDVCFGTAKFTKPKIPDFKLEYLSYITATLLTLVWVKCKDELTKSLEKAICIYCPKLLPVRVAGDSSNTPLLADAFETLFPSPKAQP